MFTSRLIASQTGQIVGVSRPISAIECLNNKLLAVLISDFEDTVLVVVKSNKTAADRRIKSDFDILRINTFRKGKLQSDEVACPPVSCECSGADIFQSTGDGIICNSNAALQIADGMPPNNCPTTLSFYRGGSR